MSRWRYTGGSYRTRSRGEGHTSITSAADQGDDTVTALSGGKSLWTARVSSRSAVRPGTRVDLAIDTSRLHFFDPVSGESIGHDPGGAGRG